MTSVYISTQASNQVKSGFPWIYKNDIKPNSSLEISEKGEIVSILDSKGKKIAVGYLNYSSNISIRILSTDINEQINEEFFRKRIDRAIEKRKKHFGENYLYSRLIFGEADNFPGFIVDSYGEYLSCEITTAGAYKLKDIFFKILTQELKPKGIAISINANDRAEGLSQQKTVEGIIPVMVEVKENGITYFANLKEGQKTGWFYDQRANRKFLAELSNGKTFCDLFTHSGGFGILAATRGAKNILMVDSSEMALNLAKESAKYNKIGDKCEFVKSDIFDFLEHYKNSGKQCFDIVNADPPAFIKAKKYIESGMKGYAKLVKGCVNLFDKDNEKIFALTSCSHHADKNLLKKNIENVFKKELPTTNYQLLTNSGADKDHLPHPHLAKTEYLKFLCYRL